MVNKIHGKNLIGVNVCGDIKFGGEDFKLKFYPIESNFSYLLTFRQIIVFILSLFTFISNCESQVTDTFVKRKYEKSIKLKKISFDEVKLTLSTKTNYKISFSKNLIIKLYQEKLKSELFYSEKNEIINKIEALNKIRNDTIFIQKQIGNDLFQGDFESWITGELLLKGKAAIFNLNSKIELKKIRYLFVEDRLGGRSGIYFEIGRNEPFFEHIIALGE